MADGPYRDDQLRLAARLYYIDGLLQAEVARLVNVSQAKVSRLLALARERGIVRISVPEYQPRDRPLERRLAGALGLKSAVVVKAEGDAAVEDLRRSVGYFAAAAVSAVLRPKSVVAIAGGRTMQALVARMRPTGRSGGGLTVVQAMGNIDSRVGPYDALELGRTLADRWGGTLLTLNTPAILPDAETRNRVLALESVRSVKKRLAKVDTALVGVGTTRNSVFVERGVLREAEFAALRKCGAVGELCGRFFDSTGRECDTPLRDRVIGIGLEDLRRSPQVVAVVAGSDRREAILAAVRGELIKSLVIDEAGASGLLASVDSSAPHNGRRR